jgi:hypothetical protein
MAFSFRSSGFRGLQASCAALAVVLLLSPTVHTQAEEPPPAKAWSVGSDKGGNLYSLNFEGGSVNDLKRVWMNAFTNDNFLIAPSAERVDLQAFQMRNMTLTELARSIAFLSQGQLTAEVVERNAGMPGNIWRVARPSSEKLAHWRAAQAPENAEWPAAAQNASALVEEALGKLPCDEATLLRSKYCDGWSTQELAANLGTTPKAIENRLARLRERLRGILLHMQ